jgi:hypothetical protein
MLVACRLPVYPRLRRIMRGPECARNSGPLGAQRATLLFALWLASARSGRADAAVARDASVDRLPGAAMPTRPPELAAASSKRADAPQSPVLRVRRLGSPIGPHTSEPSARPDLVNNRSPKVDMTRRDVYNRLNAIK